MHPNYQNKRIKYCMENKNQIFDMIEPSPLLKSSIIIKIKRAEIKRVIYQIVLSSVVSIFSILMSVVFILNIITDAYQSGLSEYISLIFSDGILITSYWQTYLMSVVESLPIILITITVASIWVFVWSVNKFLESYKNTKSFFYKIN